MSRILLKIRNLHKSYFCKKKLVKEALVDVSLDLFQGEIFTLLGVNGAGKTTLSSIVASLHPPTKGSLLWEERSIYSDLFSYRRLVGFCPQYQNLDTNFTLEENLLFQGRFYGLSKEKLQKRIGDLLEKFELKKYAKSKVDVLSGGYRQRFLIARTLIHEPQLVILDEPTVGLDPQVRRSLWEYITFLKEEKISILLTTHYLEEAEKLSDRVCVMDQGRIKLIDNPEKLKSDWRKENLEEVFLHLLKEEDQND